MKGIAIDPQTKIVREVYAVIYSPKKTGRGRYAENCVTEYANLEQATLHSDTDKHFYVAKVCGPARSSEGFRLYYLVEWLN